MKTIAQQLNVKDYPFGGSIGHQDHLEEAGTNPINNPE